MKVIIIGVGNGGTKLVGTLVHELLCTQGIWPYHYEPLFWRGIHGEKGITLNPEGLREHKIFPLLPEAGITSWPWMNDFILRLWGLAKFIRVGSRLRLFYEKEVKLIWVTRELHNFLASMQSYQRRYPQPLPGWHHRPGGHYDDYERLAEIFPEFYLKAEEGDRMAVEAAWWLLQNQEPFKLMETGRIYRLPYEDICAHPYLRMEEIAVLLGIPFEETPALKHVRAAARRQLEVSADMRKRIDLIAGELNQQIYPEIGRVRPTCSPSSVKTTSEAAIGSISRHRKVFLPSREHHQREPHFRGSFHKKGNPMLINIVYAHLGVREFAWHRKETSVMWSRAPLAGSDVYAYLDAFSYHGPQAGLEVLVMLEPVVVLPGEYGEKAWEHFDHILTFVDSLAAGGDKFHKILWPAFGRPITDHYHTRVDLSHIRPPSQKKHAICMINGHKQSFIPGELYSKRLEVARWFHENSHLPFDVYGFPPFPLPNYRGQLKPYARKFQTLSEYRYALCFENMYDPFWSKGYVSEKIIDCLMSGTLPIYLGCTNIEDYIPADCFIDFRRFKSYSDLDHFLRNLSDSDYHASMEHIHAWINEGHLSRYSMECIYDKLLSLADSTLPEEDLATQPWKKGLTSENAHRKWRTMAGHPFWSWTDLATHPEPELTKVLNLLGADQRYLPQFMANLDFHRKQSIRLYSEDAKTRFSSSFTQSHQDKLLFHSEKPNERKIQKWDQHIERNLPDIAGKYLGRYKTRDSAGDARSRLIGIIFSRDRAMQLDATLRSFAMHCGDRERVDMKVLYTSSTPEHEALYQALPAEYPFVEFIRESQFREDFLALLSKDCYRHVLFLVDDNIFVKDFFLMEALQALESHPDAVGFSLRLGKNTTFSYMLQGPQRLPPFETLPGNILKYDWKGAELDFAYPLEVSSSIYRTGDLLHLLREEDFSNPNTLESLLDSHKHAFTPGKTWLLCYGQSVTFSNALNVVQTAWQNQSGSRVEYSSESLANQFRQGYRVEVASYSGMTPNSCHQLAELTFFKAGEKAAQESAEEAPDAATTLKKGTCPRDGFLPGAGKPGLVSVILLNLNGGDHLRECIESIRTCTGPMYELIVVDNGSKDESLDYLRSLSDIKLIENKENVGAPAGRNQALALAEGEYIVFLDNDTVVTRGWLERFMACAGADPLYGVLGPMSNYVSGPQLVENATYRDYGELQDFARRWSQAHANRAFLTGRLILFCLFVKREVIKRIGGFDPAYGKWGFEDDDFCVRAQIAGYRLVIVKDIYIHHEGSQTASTSGIDYDALMRENWEVFRKKWNVDWKAGMPMEYRLDQIIVQPFDPGRHGVPIPPRSQVQKNLRPQAANFTYPGKEKTARSRHVEEQLIRGEASFDEGRYDEAEQIFRHVIHWEPFNPKAHNDLACVLWARGRPEEALEALSRAMAHAPDNRDAVWNLGQILKATGRYPDAKEVYRTYLNAHPGEIEMAETLAQWEHDTAVNPPR
jgi:GT2 family glycosyltransferase